MQYDPVKETLGSVFSQNSMLRRLFYRLLDAVILRTWHLHRELKIWSKDAPRSAHILDAGAGFGQYSYFLHKLNSHYSILGLDIKSDQVCKCNDFFRTKDIKNVFFKSGDLLNFEREKAFDLILCVDVLEYIEDDQCVFEHFYESLKDDGIFLMSAPSDKVSTYGMKDFRFPDETEYFRQGYNMADLKKRLKKLGYKKVRARYTYGKPGEISWLISIKWPVSLIRKSKYFLPLFPLYFMLIFPISLILNFIDTHMGHLSGSGIILKAYK